MNKVQMSLQVVILRQLVDVPGTNTTSWEVKGLTTGARYSFTVQSYNQQGRPSHTSPPVEVLMRGRFLLVLLYMAEYFQGFYSSQPIFNLPL